VKSSSSRNLYLTIKKKKKQTSESLAKQVEEIYRRSGAAKEDLSL